ncbi:MAG: MerR family transcriptional regulator [Defluviitaleaceae bacterium]|nr:MerR family transcriptional regulator [Defluviitaleaceae bacterium]
MEKHRAIPHGYMTVGGLAKKMGITVRAIQYYDKEGILSPSRVSEGGRRLYTDKDMVKLHQILSLKHLGFSLDEIKRRFISLDTPDDMVNALSEQEANIQNEIDVLMESLKAIRALKMEVAQIQSVDFKKYADIIANLKMKNEMYWMIKHFDDDILDCMRSQFDKESGLALMDTFKRINNMAIQYIEEGVLLESDQGQELANAYWGMVMEVTGGDMSLLPKLVEHAERMGALNFEWKKQQETIDAFIQPALYAYFTKLGYNPFGGDIKHD